MAYTTIDDPSAHFQVDLYTGQGNGTVITNDGNSNLQPDLVWFKRRGGLGYHQIVDSSRGGTKRLWANDDGAEGTGSQIASFDSDGFTCGSATDLAPADTCVAWQWKANGGTRTTNTESGNNPAGGYQANTTAGFSIVDYTGAGAAGTMAHGLGAVPHFILFKARSEDSNNWAVYHHKNTSAPETDFLRLDTQDATTDNDNFMNDTAPTSSVFTVNTGSKVNSDGETYIAYAWTGIQGYSKFGVYTGTADEDGPFVYTGFRPGWILIKNTANYYDWVVLDHKRPGFNPESYRLKAHDNSVEYTGLLLDIYSNGFKPRNTSGDTNLNDGTIVYAAFAAHPFVTSGGVPCTAV